MCTINTSDFGELHTTVFLQHSGVGAKKGAGSRPACLKQQIQGPPGLHRETLLKKKERKRNAVTWPASSGNENSEDISFWGERYVMSLWLVGLLLPDV